MAVFRLAHLSDLHLTGAAEEEALARSVFRSLRDYDVDHVVVTGDLSEHGERSAFRMFDNARRKFGYGPRRSTVLIGNHDIRRRRAFASRFGGGAVTIRELDHGDLCLIGLDSAQVVTGFPSGAHDPKGYLDDDQLEELEQALRRRDGRKVVVALHHHVFDVPRDENLGMRLGKYIGLWGPLTNAGSLLEILGRHGVRLVLTGHSHIDRKRTVVRRGTRITCVIGGSTIQPGQPADDEPGTLYDYGVFDFVAGELVSDGRVDLD